MAINLIHYKRTFLEFFITAANLLFVVVDWVINTLPSLENVLGVLQETKLNCTMVDIDKDFPKSVPFGLLKTLQWAAPLAFVITIYCGSYWFDGVWFSMFVAWNAFMYSLITWICYLLGIHRKTFQVGQGTVFIPFALMDFLVSTVFLVLFAISSLICVVCIFGSIKYRFGILLTYFFATVFALVSGAAYGYYALLLYRECPNGQLRNLSTLVVEGTTISSRPELGSSERPSA